MVNEYTAASIAWQQQQAQQNVDNDELVEPELAAEGFQAIIGQKSLDAFLLLVEHFQSEFFL